MCCGLLWTAVELRSKASREKLVLSKKSKATIDALPKEELVLEVGKANLSRFQGEKFAYLKSRLSQIEDSEEIEQHKAELDQAYEANKISRDANRIAEGANNTAKKAWRASLLSAVVAIVAIIVSMCGRQ